MAHRGLAIVYSTFLCILLTVVPHQKGALGSDVLTSTGAIDRQLLAAMEGTKPPMRPVLTKEVLQPESGEIGSTGKASTIIPNFDAVPQLNYEALLSLHLINRPELANSEELALSYYFFKNPRGVSCSNLRYSFKSSEVERDRIKIEARKLLSHAYPNVSWSKTALYKVVTQEKIGPYNKSKGVLPLIVNGFENTVLNEGANLSFTAPPSSCLYSSTSTVPNAFKLTVFKGNAMSEVPMSLKQLKAFTETSPGMDRGVTVESLIQIYQPKMDVHPNGYVNEAHFFGDVVGARVLNKRGAVIHMFSREMFDGIPSPNISGIDVPPLSPYILTMRLIADEPDVLDQETLTNLTVQEAKYAQDFYQRGEEPPNDELFPAFDRQMVEGRDPQFLAMELSSEFGKRLSKLAQTTGRRVWVEQNLNVEGYDSARKMLYLKKQGNQAAELLPTYYLTTNDQPETPQAAKNLRFYQLAPVLLDRGKAPFRSLDQNNKLLLRDGVLALDRVLQLEGIPMEPEQAERLSRDLGGFGNDTRYSLRARVALTIQQVSKNTGKFRVPLVRARVDQVDILKPGDITLLSLKPEEFVSAIDLYKPKAAKLDIVTAKESGPEMLDGEILDLLIVKCLPEKFDQGMTERMMQARWSYEQKVERPKGGRFFEGARKPNHQDLERLAPQFREWTLNRAGQMGNRFILRIKGQLDQFGFSPYSREIASMRRWAPQLSGYISEDEYQRRTAMLNDGPGPEWRWWWELSFKPRDYPYTRESPPNTMDILHLSGGFPAPTEDLLPRLEKGDSNSPYYGVEYDLEISNVLFNPGLEGTTAYILEAEVKEGRFFELDSDKTPLMKFGKMLARFTPAEIAEKIFKLDEDKATEAVPKGPYGPDVVGIQLGMSFDEAEQVIRKHMKVGRTLKMKNDSTTAFEKREPYSSGRLFVAEDGKDYIAIFDEPPTAPGKVVGLWRQVHIAGDQIKASDLVDNLIKKYGKPNSQQGKGGNFKANWPTMASSSSPNQCYPKIIEMPDNRWLQEDGSPALLPNGAGQREPIQLPKIYLGWGYYMAQKDLDRTIDQIYGDCGAVVNAHCSETGSDYHLIVSIVDLSRYARLFIQSNKLIEAGKVNVTPTNKQPLPL